MKFFHFENHITLVESLMENPTIKLAYQDSLRTCHDMGKEF